jgi:hypothetical protein
MDLKRIFLLSLAAGAVVALVYVRNAGDVSHSVDAPIAHDAIPAADSNTKVAEPPSDSAAPSAGAPRTEGLAAPAPPRHDDDSAARSKAQKTAERLAANETLTREQLHGMLERTFEGKLHDRELTPSEYDRLAEAVFKIRASQRVLQGIPESEDTSAVRALYVAQVKTAFADVQDILGIAPSQLGDVLGSGDGAEAPN